MPATRWAHDHLGLVVRRGSGGEGTDVLGEDVGSSNLLVAFVDHRRKGSVARRSASRTIERIDATTLGSN